MIVIFINDNENKVTDIVKNVLSEQGFSIGAEMAIKLSDTFNTTPDFWLNAQHAVDIYRANRKIKIHPESLIKVS
jgi:plasmid maintenance system antidote protein VapI